MAGSARTLGASGKIALNAERHVRHWEEGAAIL